MSRNHVTLAIISPQRLEIKLKPALKIAVDAYNQPLNANYFSIMVSHTIDGLILTEAGKQLVDFVGIVVDTTSSFPIKDSKKILQRLSASVVATRTCLVNGTCRSGSLSTAKELFKLGDEFKVPVINAEIDDIVSCKMAATNLLKIAVVITGAETGVPIPLSSFY